MLTWNKVTPQPTEDWTAHSGNGYFSVGPDANNKRIWQYFSLSVGEYSNRPIKACCKLWPREAIAKMRAALDRIETELANDELVEVAREVGDIRNSLEPTPLPPVEPPKWATD